MNNLFKSEVYRNITGKLGNKELYNDTFWNTYYMLEKTKSWSLKQFREYQMNELSRLIDYAYRNTTYYRRLMNEYGWKPQHFQDFDDVKKIPVITKEVLKNNLEDLRAMPIRKCIAVTTGGTTGIPTKVYLESSETRMKRLAFVWHSFHEGGYFFGDKIAVLRGVVTGEENHIIDKKENALYCSSMKMSEKNMKEYIYLIQKFDAKHIRAYPSSAELLAKYIRDTGVAFNEKGRIKTLFTSSETLTKEAKVLIETYLKVKVKDLWGNCEQIGMIAQCGSGHYHEYMCHSYLEYLDDDNREVVNGKGRIVGTGFINRALPLIRYDTGDYVCVSKRKNCRCGNCQRQIGRIIGRRKRNDVLMGKDNNLVNLSAINTHADIFDNIYKLQFVQKEKGNVLIRVMPNSRYTDIDRKKIYTEFRQRLGDLFELELKETDTFEYTSRGKSKLLVQNIEDL